MRYNTRSTCPRHRQHGLHCNPWTGLDIPQNKSDDPDKMPTSAIETYPITSKVRSPIWGIRNNELTETGPSSAEVIHSVSGGMRGRRKGLFARSERAQLEFINIMREILPGSATVCHRCHHSIPSCTRLMSRDAVRSGLTVIPAPFCVRLGWAAAACTRISSYPQLSCSAKLVEQPI